jgi:hypothetical protein
MRTTIAIKCVIVLLVASGATFSAPAQSADVLKSLETLQVVPRAHQWSLVAPELRPALQQAVQLSPEIVERLARGDARQRGIAIFIADQQGDVARLLALAQADADERWRHYSQLAGVERSLPESPGLLPRPFVPKTFEEE